MKFNKLMIIALCGILLTSCNQGNNGEEKQTETQIIQTTEKEEIEDIPEEKVVRKAFGEELMLSIRNPITLNPLLNLDETVDRVLKLTFETLFEIDEKGQAVPRLIESYTFSDNHTYLTLTVKDNIRFHDNTSLTSEDIAYSLEVLMDDQTKSLYKSKTNNIQRIAVIDDKNIRIYYKQPYAFALYDLVFPIIKKDYYMDNENTDFNPVGTGAYQFVSFTNMKELKLTFFNSYREHYWIKDIYCKITRDEAAENTAFKQKLIDITAPAKFNWQTYYEDETTAMYEYTTNYYEFIGFNFENQLLKTKDFRKVFANAVDKDSILKDLYLSHAMATKSIVNTNNWLIDERSVSMAVDIEKARSYIEKNGFTDKDGDGFYNDKGVSSKNITFRLLVNRNNDLRMKMAEMIKEDLAEVGIVIDIMDKDREEFIEALSNSEYDLVLTAIKLNNKPDFTNLFHSESTGGSNFINYKNEYMNAILEAIYRSKTDKQFINNLEEFNDYFIDEIPYLSLFFLNSVIITNDDVYGDFSISSDVQQLDINELYISR